MLLMQTLVGHIRQIAQRRYDFDILLMLIPKNWESYCQKLDENFDLHDQLKAICAVEKIPLQIVKETGALAYNDRASVMWRIGVALYAKAGGIPWKLADTGTDTAYIGLSYAIKASSHGSTQFVTCCSQVFDSDGSGLEFVAYSTDEVEFERENPFLSRTEMFRVMTRSLDLYRRRHAGRIPKKIVVHKTTEFKTGEIDGCMDAFHLCESVDLIRIVQSVGWRGVLIDNSQDPLGARFPVERGTLLNIGRKEALLWIHGNVSKIDHNKPYFQGKRSTPQPVKLVRDAGHGAWDQTAAATLALSKMDWNNDALYGQLPVTLSYSKVLANVIKRMPNLGAAPYEYRYFM
jgi:argonaute-like protein implicated in RNA metabolism and viral defense